MNQTEARGNRKEITKCAFMRASVLTVFNGLQRLLAEASLPPQRQSHTLLQMNL